MIEKSGTGIEKSGTGIEKSSTGIEKSGKRLLVVALVQEFKLQAVELEAKVCSSLCQTAQA